MRERRPAAGKLEDLARGPGRLTMAMGITAAITALTSPAAAWCARAR